MGSPLELRQILSYDDVAQYSAGRSSEPLVDVATYDSRMTGRYLKRDMVAITGEVIYVRDAIARKLARIEATLRERGYRLNVVYGYRHPKVQRDYFENRKAAIAQENPQLTGKDLNVYTHNFVADPDIAGHPAGAAVDLTLMSVNGSAVDMGTAIADYTDEKKIKTFADGLTAEQHEHRQLLHDLMVAEGFAPFYGEWWHFSYGDREWAAFYDKKALYDVIDFQVR